MKVPGSDSSFKRSRILLGASLFEAPLVTGLLTVMLEFFNIVKGLH